MDLTIKDRNIPILNNVLFCRDGTVIGLCKNMIAVVEPLSPEIRDKLHLKNTFNKDDIFLSSDNVKKIVQSLPVDTTFKGLLEFCDIFLDKKQDKVIVTTHDGTQSTIKTMNYVKEDSSFVKSILKEIFEIRQDLCGECRMIIGLQRYSNLLTVLKKIINDKNDEIPICQNCFSMNKKRYLNLKSQILKTGQQVIGIAWINDKDVDEYWIEKGLIERRFEK